jgi:hypothetical protein
MVVLSQSSKVTLAAMEGNLIIKKILSLQPQLGRQAGVVTERVLMVSFIRPNNVWDSTLRFGHRNISPNDYYE